MGIAFSARPPAARAPISRRQLRPAVAPRLRPDPPGRPREGRDAGARRARPRPTDHEPPGPLLARPLPAGRRLGRLGDGALERPAVPHHPALPDLDVPGARRAAHPGRGVAMTAFLLQLLHMALVLALAPGVTGIVRKLKARLLGRQGPPVIQPYRDLVRLLRKDA